METENRRMESPFSGSRRVNTNYCRFSESPWRRLQVKPPTGAFFITLLGVEKTKDALFSEQEPEKMAEPVFG